MKKIVMMVALLFATLTATTAQTKVVASKLRITTVRDAKALATDSKGNVIAGTEMALSEVQSELAEKLDKGEYEGTAADLAEALNELADKVKEGNTNAEDLQPLIAKINANKEAIENLGISNVQGLQNELTRIENLITNFKETDPKFTAWDKDYNDLINKPAIPESVDISGKVDKVNGKGLSTNDYTNEDKTKLTNASTKINNLENTLNERSGLLVVAQNGKITAPSLEISNIDTDKCLTTKEYLDAKTNEIDASGKIAEMTTKLEQIEADVAKKLDKDVFEEKRKNALGIAEGLSEDISGKVDKVDGKGLSTNDYTNEDKTKLTNASTKINNLENTLNERSGLLVVAQNGKITAPSLEISDINTDKCLVTKEYIDLKTEQLKQLLQSLKK